MIHNIREKFANFVIDNNVIGFFKEPITLKSGRVSYWYVNWRDIVADVYLTDELSDFIIKYVKELNLEPKCFFGVPEGATKIGLITQFKWAKSQNDYGEGEFILSMGRGAPKKHGQLKDRYYLGVPRGNLIILEDVTTTGQSLIEVVDKFLELEIKITATISLTNRDEIRPDGKTVEEILNTKDIPYYSMSNALELLPKIYQKTKIDQKIARKVEEYFLEYGVKKLKLIY
ncbi:MAG: hypothetical protein BAJALOKI3v1_270010 [Promethearchaeota archaeon]|nr:MAG: hypothetical protein BAJALOKI3v1_270010 [Candidatus Lokiarchaeota archaeon]